MRTPQFFIQTKKVYAGHFEVTVTDEMNNIEKSYTETDMSNIDDLEDDDESIRFEAMETLIRKAGF